MLGEIPFLSLLSGYLFHPAYIVMRPNGSVVVRLVKEPSFCRKFSVAKLAELQTDEEEPSCWL